MQGAVAWSAYAIAEFASSSLLFDLARPYARFTTWHWQLTATLVIAYLAIGLVVGALAGAATWFLTKRTQSIGNKDRSLVLEGAATLTVVIGFVLNIAAAPFSPTGTPVLLLTGGVMGALLVAGIRSARWSERLGFLTNPWVVAGLLLGVGQGINLLEMQDLARQL